MSLSPVHPTPPQVPVFLYWEEGFHWSWQGPTHLFPQPVRWERDGQPWCLGVGARKRACGVQRLQDGRPSWAL